MKITSTFMAIIMGCAVLAFNACDDNSSSKNKTKQTQTMLLLCSGKTYAIGGTGPSGVGIVFYTTNYGKHGLEAAPADQSTGEAWSTITGAYANGSSALPTGIGTGSANTDAIIAQNSKAASAAETCRSYTGGGMTDWFLPSKDELNQLYLQKAGVGGFADDYYWSSSEFTAFNAWYQYFNDGGQTNINKSLTNRVRPVRAF